MSYTAVTRYVVWSMTYLFDKVQVFDVLLFFRDDLADNSRFLELSNRSFQRQTTNV